MLESLEMYEHLLTCVMVCKLIGVTVDNMGVFIVIIVTVIAISAVWLLANMMFSESIIPEFDVPETITSVMITIGIIFGIKRLDLYQKRKQIHKFWNIQFVRFDKVIIRKNIKKHVINLLRNFESVTGKVSDLYDEVFYTKYLERIHSLQTYVEGTMKPEDNDENHKYNYETAKNIVKELKDLVSGV